ncbi:MAG TPA: hypothetical protein VGW38_24560, partial [Chloroflexota bacterium]|nr:hypothetical protein [Chloroflexota bacterium]
GRGRGGTDRLFALASPAGDPAFGTQRGGVRGALVPCQRRVVAGERRKVPPNRFDPQRVSG